MPREYARKSTPRARIFIARARAEPSSTDEFLLEKATALAQNTRAQPNPYGALPTLRPAPAT
jgi:hypothetical protein